jgi:hypothetical protein
VQVVAEPSQKFTCPRVTGEPPTVTATLRVTTAGETTVDTTLPPDVIVSVVFVGAGVAKALPGVQQSRIRKARTAYFPHVYAQMGNLDMEANKAEKLLSDCG